jgi:5-methylcytosine-specific restriction endonuclease McrA
MPRALTVCGVPRCPKPAVHEGLCRDHRRVRGQSWYRLRKRAIERAEHTCENCGATDVPLEVHHIRPMIAGGDEVPELDEVLVMCKPCHVRWTWGR